MRTMSENTIVIGGNVKPGDWALLRNGKVIANSDNIVKILELAEKYPEHQVRIMPVLLGQACYY